MKIGPETQAAIRRIVDVLPYLKAEGTAAPSALHPQLNTIRTASAGKQPSGARDPHFEAANEWAEKELADALERDNAKPSAKEAEPEPEAEPAPGKKAEAHPAHPTTHKTHK